MTTFLLARHGAHDLLGKRLAGRSPGVHINETGSAQAMALSERLKGRDVSAIYSSPLERCLETAIPIASAQNMPIHIDPAFDEVNFGGWTGLAFQDLQGDRDWQQWNDARAVSRCPGGESMLEAQARITKGLRELATQYPQQTVLIVSHCDVLKAALMHFLGLSLDRILAFEISAASLSTIQIADWGSTVVSMNERL